jgi:hypothetical protein
MQEAKHLGGLLLGTKENCPTGPFETLVSKAVLRRLS